MNIAIALAKEFPFMRAKPENNIATGRADDLIIKDLFTAFGCQCGQGWYEMLRSMCKEIEDAYKEKNKTPDIEIHQIKEKYGTLRVYYASSINIRYIINKYEKLSETTCEECGQPGIMHDDNGWFFVRCSDCFEGKNSREVNARPHPLLDEQVGLIKQLSNLTKTGSSWAEE